MIGKFWKTLIAVTVCCACVLSLASCSGGIDGNEAKDFIGSFFEAIAAEDYETAKGYLHPERPGDLEAFFVNTEKDCGVDFQAGIEVERYTNVSFAYYDSTVEGSTYETTMKTAVGDDTVWFTIELVQNDAGFGIYNLDLDVD